MERAIDMWEGRIWAIDGAIEPAKSFWYLVDFVWHRGNWRYATKEDCPASIEVCDLHGDRQIL